MKNALVVIIALLALPLAACSARQAEQQEISAANRPIAGEIIFVTPTAMPTLVPTAARRQPTALPSRAPDTSQSRGASALDEPATCEEALERFYASASDHCLTGPTGYFCSAGLPPTVQPASDALSEAGALAEMETIDSLRSAPLSAAEGGGLVWLRLEEDILMDALLVGDVHISNLVSADSTFAQWRSLTIESGTSTADCETAPTVGALVVQGLYGLGARLVINGVSVEINGTLVVVTQGALTKFIVIEGQVILVAFGHTVALNVGQQLSMRYADGDWSRPAQLPGEPELLEHGLIRNLPAELFDRALPIPLPGYAQTQGRVNMRAAPDIGSRLLYQVPAGETMSILGISADREWLHIRLGNGETGWMSAELLVRRLGEVQQFYDLTPEPPQRYGAYADLATVNVSAGGNLRTAPDTAFGVKRTLPYGLAVTLLARSPYSPWVKVEAGGDIGWMALFTLQTESVITSLPIDYDVPLPPRATPTPSFSFGGGHAYPDPEGGY